MQSFNCLSRELSLRGHFFIEASAGTGKTFAIEHLVTRLIMGGMNLSEILIVTFTKASTRDLKMRIHQNLVRTSALLEREDTSDYPDYLLAISDKKEALLLIENALALMEDMSIYTIHSFCYQMLSTYAFEAKVDFEGYDPDDEEHRGQMNRVILDALRTFDDKDLIHPASLQKLMDLYQRDLGKFVKKFLSFLSGDPKIADYPTFREIRDNIETLLRGVSKESLLDELYFFAEHHKGLCDRSKKIHPRFIEEIDALAAGDLASVIWADTTLFETLDPSQRKAKYQNVDLSAKMPSNYLVSLIPAIESLRDVTITFLHLAKFIQQRLQQADIKGPDDLLITMLDRLSIPEFKKLVQENYLALIVDEFQDTDALQWSIFLKLFYQSVDLLAVVGDPKQSIYSFRGADIETFLKAKDLFSEHFALRVNYRSSPTVIETLNRLFDPLRAPGWLSFSDRDNRIIYEQVAAGKTETTPHDPAVSFFLFEGMQRRPGNFPSPEIEQDLIFPKIAETILDLHEKRGVDLAKIALLIKDRFQAKRLACYLEQCRIPLAANTSSSLKDTEAFSFIKLAIKATLDPKNQSYVKQFLAHPFIGWPLEKLSEDPIQSGLATVISIFQTLKGILETAGSAPYLHALLRTRFVKAPLIFDLSLNEDTISDVLQILPLLFTTPAAELLQKIEDLESIDLDEMPFLKRRPLKDGSAAILMTSHLSKGLEFDYVLACGLGYRSKAKHETVTLEGGEEVLFAGDCQKTRRALEKIDQEKMRLLYVTLTRAKKALFVYFPINSLEVQPAYGSASPLEIFTARLGRPFLPYEKLYEEIALLSARDLANKLEATGAHVEIVEWAAMRKKQPVEVNADLIPPTPLSPLEQKTYFYSFSSIASSLPHSPLPPDPKALPAGPVTGNALHLLLEKIIETGIYYRWQEEKIKELVERDLFNSHLKPWQDEILRMLYFAFHHPIDSFIPRGFGELGFFKTGAPPLNSLKARAVRDRQAFRKFKVGGCGCRKNQFLTRERYTLADVPPERMIQESAFLYQLSSHQYMKGFADLVFVQNGKYYILDWKLNRLGGYDEETLKQAMHRHDYYTQASIYRDALEKHLAISHHAPFDTLFGGTLYAFLRGKEEGWLHFFPKPFVGVK